MINLSKDRSVSDFGQWWAKELDKSILLSAEEELALARRVKKGEKEARDQFIRSNLLLVESEARSKVGKLSLEDLRGEGLLALCEAANKFDPERGFKFSSYAIILIKGSMIKAIKRQDNMLKTPEAKIDLAIAIRKFCDLHSMMTGEEPSQERIVSEFNVSSCELLMLLSLLKDDASLDELVDYDNNGSTEGDFVQGQPFNVLSNLENEALRIAVENNLLELAEKNKRWARVIMMSNGLCGYEKLSCQEIATMFNVSTNAIRQSISWGMKYLAALMRADKNLEGFLPSEIEKT